MDPNKTAYFVAKYRAATAEELEDLVSRRSSLADEAEAAIMQVAQERGVQVKAAVDAVAALEITTKERLRQTELSTELWKGPLSTRVKYQFAFLFAMPVLHIAGAQGLRLGALLLLAAAAPAWYFGQRFGYKYTKMVCANGDKSIEEKRSQLRTTSWLLWPGIVGATLAAAVVLRVIRGV